MSEAKALYKADRTRKDAFFRKPCFHDPEAEAQAMEKIRQVVSAQMRFKPFFHSTDETGVANLIEAWDFCFDPRTLAAMRQWLVEQYGSLDGINRQWGTNFQRLDDVTPLTTDEMMQRGDDNWSPWADHRTFMNLTFAKAARKASDTVKAVDPAAIGGLVGGQAPSAFGGYDYWLLSKAIQHRRQSGNLAIVCTPQAGFDHWLWSRAHRDLAFVVSGTPRRPRCHHLRREEPLLECRGETD